MWKTHQSKNIQQRKVKLALLALGVLVAILVLGRSLNLISSLQKPLDSTLSLTKENFWDFGSAINFVLTSKEREKLEISIISFQPKEKRVVLLKLSDQIYLEVPKDFGYWTLGSVYKLGQEQNPPVGSQLLQLSISKLLGLPIDGIIISKNPKSSDSSQNFLSKLHKNPLLILAVMANVQTNLSPVQTIKLFWALSQIRKDKIISLDLASSYITESKLLPDSSRVLGVDSIKLDYFIRQNMSDQSILEEENTVAVFNGTQIAGLAQEVARVVTNMGGNVVMISNLEGDIDKSQVVILGEEVDKIRDSLTAKRLTQVFAPNCLKKPCLLDDPKINFSRAQINIVLGEDYYNFWHKR